MSVEVSRLHNSAAAARIVGDVCLWYAGSPGRGDLSIRCAAALEAGSCRPASHLAPGDLPRQLRASACHWGQGCIPTAPRIESRLLQGNTALPGAQARGCSPGPCMVWLPGDACG